MSIVVSNISKKFGAQKALNNISFTINKNEIVGFLGPNGAGKSTTMKIITGYLVPDSGMVQVGGVAVNHDNTATKQKIGYLPEANPLYVDMYVREYLSFIAGIHDISNAKKRVEEVILLVGLSPEVHKKIGELSKGYKQRVGIAAALIHDPEVLILDEPTSGLDPNQIIEIREVIKKLGEQKTILFSSHIMQEVEALCKRVVIINKGNIVADDLLSNLQKGNTESHFVSVQFKESLDKKDFSGIKDCFAIRAVEHSTFIFETNHPEQVRKQLLALSIEKNLNIISLNSEKQHLEAIFKTLTQ